MSEITKALAPVSKAIAGSIAGALVVFLAKYNIVIADDLSNAIEVLLGAVFAYLVVYLSPANKAS